MFYDNTVKKYSITYHDGTVVELTKQELWEFYVFNTHGISETFDEVVESLDDGETVDADDYEFDFFMGAPIRKGSIVIKNIIAPPIFKREYFADKFVAEANSQGKCNHKNKYVNSAGGVKFWYCRDCKKDLGDA